MISPTVYWLVFAAALLNGSVVGWFAHSRWGHGRPTSKPIPPTNVRAEFADGTVVPVELAYTGWREDAHLWVSTVVFEREVRAVLVDEMGPATRIRVQCLAVGE